MRRDDFDPVATAMADHYHSPHWAESRPEEEPTPLEFANRMTSFQVAQALLAVVCVMVGTVGTVYVIVQLAELVMSL
ncbi:hypothetical protein AALF15_01125 [Corynebacteriaceae bacterium 7-707]